VGALGVATAFSLYECPEELAGAIRGRLGRSPGFVEGEAWYQGDHMIFVQSGVPAVALTSANFMEIETQVAHTERDRPELVDTGQLARIARALAALVETLSTNSTN
jgi:aminopeptidase YwaD